MLTAKLLVRMHTNEYQSSLAADNLDGNRLQLEVNSSVEEIISQFSSPCSKSHFTFKKKFFVNYLSCFDQHTAIENLLDSAPLTPALFAPQMMVGTLIGPAGHSVTRAVETARNTAHDHAQIPRQQTAAMTAHGLEVTRKCPFVMTVHARVRNVSLK